MSSPQTTWRWACRTLRIRSAWFSEAGCPVCIPVSVRVTGLLNSNVCLSFDASEGLWLPPSLQALLPAASVSQAEGEK